MINRFFLFFLVLIFHVSCTIYREYQIEVLQPKQVNFFKDTVNAVLIYRNFKYPNDTLAGFYRSDFTLKKDKTLDRNDYDSLIVMNCFNGFISTLNENKIFSKITAMPPDMIKRHSAEKMNPLNRDMVKKITFSAGTELLISLETFSAFFSEFSMTNESGASNQVVTVAIWSIYNSETGKEFERKTMIDTVFWDGTDAEGNPSKLPARKTALEMASKLAGQNYAKRFSPSWIKTYRMYVIPPLEDFRLAAAFFEEGKWDEAIKLWEKYTASRHGKIAIGARYNMALGLEMNDNLETAISWINKAYEQAVLYKSTEDIKMILLYKKVLEKRLEQIQIINAEEKPQNN